MFLTRKVLPLKARQSIKIKSIQNNKAHNNKANNNNNKDRKINNFFIYNLKYKDRKYYEDHRFLTT